MSLQDKIKNAKETSWPLENWKTIDNLVAFAQGLECLGDIEHAENIRQAIDIMRKYQIFQDQSLSLYMERLKADMVAMLTDLQLEIEELDTPSNGDAYMTCSDIIQQKINALKENTDGANSD